MEKICEYSISTPHLEEGGEIGGEVFIPDKVPGYCEALDKYGAEYRRFFDEILDDEFYELSRVEQDYVSLEWGSSVSQMLFDKSENFRKRVKEFRDSPPQKLEKYLKAAKSFGKAKKKRTKIFEDKVHPNIEGKIVISEKFSNTVEDLDKIEPTSWLIYKPKAFIGPGLGTHFESRFFEMAHRYDITAYYIPVERDELTGLVKNLKQGDKIKVVQEKLFGVPRGSIYKEK